MSEILPDNENVARAVFSPQMIGVDGILLLSAFALRIFKDGTKESYISVSRMSVNTWMTDIKGISQYKNRRLYGYATLNIRQIRSITLYAGNHPIIYDVIDCSNTNCKSHAGIIVQINDTILTGGHNSIIDKLEIDEPEDFVMVAIQAELLKIAKTNLVRL